MIKRSFKKSTRKRSFKKSTRKRSFKKSTRRSFKKSTRKRSFKKSTRKRSFKKSTRKSTRKSRVNNIDGNIESHSMLLWLLYFSLLEDFKKNDKNKNNLIIMISGLFKSNDLFPKVIKELIDIQMFRRFSKTTRIETSLKCKFNINEVTNEWYKIAEEYDAEYDDVEIHGNSYHSSTINFTWSIYLIIMLNKYINMDINIKKTAIIFLIKYSIVPDYINFFDKSGIFLFDVYPSNDYIKRIIKKIKNDCTNLKTNIDQYIVENIFKIACDVNIYDKLCEMIIKQYNESVKRDADSGKYLNKILIKDKDIEKHYDIIEYIINRKYSDLFFLFVKNGIICDKFLNQDKVSNYLSDSCKYSLRDIVEYFLQNYFDNSKKEIIKDKFIEILFNCKDTELFFTVLNFYKKETIQTFLDQKKYSYISWLSTEISNGNKLIFYMIENNMYDCVKYIIDNYIIDLSVKNNDNLTPLLYSCENSDIYMFEYLYNKSSEKNVLEYIIKNNNIEILNKYIELTKELKIDKDFDEESYDSFKHCDYEILYIFLNTFDVNDKFKDFLINQLVFEPNKDKNDINKIKLLMNNDKKNIDNHFIKLIEANINNYDIIKVAEENDIVNAIKENNKIIDSIAFMIDNDDTYKKLKEYNEKYREIKKSTIINESKYKPKKYNSKIEIGDINPEYDNIYTEPKKKEKRNQENYIKEKLFKEKLLEESKCNNIKYKGINKSIDMTRKIVKKIDITNKIIKEKFINHLNKLKQIEYDLTISNIDERKNLIQKNIDEIFNSLNINETLKSYNKDFLHFVFTNGEFLDTYKIINTDSKIINRKNEELKSFFIKKLEYEFDNYFEKKDKSSSQKEYVEKRLKYNTKLIDSLKNFTSDNFEYKGDIILFEILREDPKKIYHTSNAYLGQITCVKCIKSQLLNLFNIGATMIPLGGDYNKILYGYDPFYENDTIWCADFLESFIYSMYYQDYTVDDIKKWFNLLQNKYNNGF